MGAAGLLAGASAFQGALVLGVPWGAHAYGGRAVDADGVLPATHRAGSLGASLLLVTMSVLVLARAGVVDARQVSPTVLSRATWGVVVLVAGNTLGNATSTSAVERWGWGRVTALAAVLTSAVARSPLATNRPGTRL